MELVVTLTDGGLWAAMDDDGKYAVGQCIADAVQQWLIEHGKNIDTQTVSITIPVAHVITASCGVYNEKNA